MQCFFALDASQVALVVKNPHVNAGGIRDLAVIPVSRRFLGGGHGNTLQYSCLENPMGRGTWWAMIHSITESETIERLSKQACMHFPLASPEGCLGTRVELRSRF